MTSRRRDDLITLERNTGTSENAFGEVTATWTTLATAWAQVIYGNGNERRKAGLEGADQPATFRVLANSVTRALTVQDRISFGGAWDIVNVSPLDRDAIEITAIRRASQ